MLVGWSRVATQSQISLGTDLKTPFSRCFGLKTLKIRGASFKNLKACFVDSYAGMFLMDSNMDLICLKLFCQLIFMYLLITHLCSYLLNFAIL